MLPFRLGQWSFGDLTPNTLLKALVHLTHCVPTWGHLNVSMLQSWSFSVRRKHGRRNVWPSHVCPGPRPLQPGVRVAFDACRSLPKGVGLLSTPYFFSIAKLVAGNQPAIFEVFGFETILTISDAEGRCSREAVRSIHAPRHWPHQARQAT